MGAGNFAVYTAFKAKDGVSPVFKNMIQGANGFQGRLGRLNNSIVGVGKSIRNNLIGTLAGYFSFQVFKNIGQGIISVTAKFEQFRISLQTLLKSKNEGDKFFNSLVKFASITPLEVKDIVPAARQLLAYGLTQDKMIDKLGRLSDLAMGDSEKFSQLVYAYGKTKTIGIASMKELRMFSTAGVPIFDAISKYKKISKSALLDAVKHRKITYTDIDDALTRLTNKDGMFYHMTLKQSQTLQGLWSTSKDTLDMIADRLGNSGNHLNAMKGALRYFNAHQEGITKFLLKLSDGIDKIIISFMPVFDKLKVSFRELAGSAPALKSLFFGVVLPGLGLAVDVLNGLFDIIGKTYNFIKKHWTGIAPILSGVAASFLAIKTAQKAMAAWTVISTGLINLETIAFRAMYLWEGLCALSTWKLTAAQSAFNTALGVSVSGLGLFALAVGAAAAGAVVGVELYNKWLPFRKLINSLVWDIDKIKSLWGGGAGVDINKNNLRGYGTKNLEYNSIEGRYTPKWGHESEYYLKNGLYVPKESQPPLINSQSAPRMYGPSGVVEIRSIIENKNNSQITSSSSLINGHSLTTIPTSIY